MIYLLLPRSVKEDVYEIFLSLLGFFFVLLLLLNSVIAFANGIVNLRVQIQSGYLIEVHKSLVFPALAPGQTVEQKFDC